jgi:ketosteroid isomerase-like protein
VIARRFAAPSSFHKETFLMADPTIDEKAVLRANERFYEALSAGSIEGISAACAHDADVTALHETSVEVAVGWPAVLDSWKAVPFDSFAELSCVMTNPAVKVHGSIARVTGLERVRGQMKNGEPFAFTALGTNIYEKRGDDWLIVHHHASKAAERRTS